jgi:hypothetical protein
MAATDRVLGIDPSTGRLPDIVLAELGGRFAPAGPPKAGLKNLKGMAPVAPRGSTNVYGDVAATRTNTFYMSQMRYQVTSKIGSLAPVFANFTSVPSQVAERPNTDPITVRAAVIVPVERIINSIPRGANDPYTFIPAPAYILSRARVGDFIVTAAGTSREEMLEVKLINTGNSYIEHVTNRINPVVAGDALLLVRPVPLTFRGSRDFTLAPGATIQSDPVVLDHRGPDDAFPHFWIRTYVTVASGGKIPINSFHLAGIVPGDGVETGTTGAVDKTTSGVVTPSVNAAFGYGPSAIVGTTPGLTKIWALRGDSIPSGQGDDAGDVGYAVRAAVTARASLIRASQGGERGAAGVGPGWRGALLDGATDVIWEYPTNDISNGDGSPIPGRALICMSTTLLAAQEARDRGARFWTQTIFPRNSSTDSWATLTNQSSDSRIVTERALYNDWVRAGCPVDSSGNPVVAGTAGATPSPLVNGYIEVADTVENSRNDNKWKVNGAANYLTSDGIHPTAAGHALAAAPLVARFNA